MSYGTRDMLYKAKFLDRRAGQLESEAKECRETAAELRQKAEGKLDARHLADR